MNSLVFGRQLTETNILKALTTKNITALGGNVFIRLDFITLT